MAHPMDNEEYVLVVLVPLVRGQQQESLKQRGVHLQVTAKGWDFVQQIWMRIAIRDFCENDKLGWLHSKMRWPYNLATKPSATSRVTAIILAVDIGTVYLNMGTVTHLHSQHNIEKKTARV
jgi:hypothetical protein